jgi:hypothetical protein
MPKRGLLFEKVVADIIQSFGEVSDVVQGAWISGPYGRRDRDVCFSAVINGKEINALVECKDYNPRTTGRVGIDLIDALDSKRRDLGIDFPFICSNAGFTQPAMKKAKAVGIATIGALRMGDHRLRFQVSDTFFTRKITLSASSIKVDFVFQAGFEPVDSTPIDVSALRFEGAKFNNWVISHIRWIVGRNPIVNGYVHDSLRLSQPITLDWDSGSLVVAALEIDFEVRGAWYKHEVTIDASNGVYSWSRKRPYIGARDQRSVQIRNLDIHAGQLVARPPDYILHPLPYMPGEAFFEFVKFHGPMIEGLIPNLGQYLSLEDRKVKILTGLDEAAYTSTPNYEYPRD